MLKNFLFITWDGPQTSYMEGLFMPIFQEMSKKEAVQFHVLQFTWADQNKISQTKVIAKQMGIHYTALPILRKPNASAGSLVTVFTSVKKIKKYIREHQIDIVMPRSTFPALMINQILKVPFKGFRSRSFQLIFDADGLPLEERVDFAGLQRSSYLYRFLKAAETKMLRNADAVITRSQKAIDIHVATLGEKHRKNFSVVFNGRDPEHFKIDVAARSKARKNLGIQSELVFVYAGSLGLQYCLPEMLQIFRNHSKNSPSKFLILTGNTAFAEEHIPEDLKPDIIIKSVPSEEVAFYLNAGDCAFALRQPSFSMQGVAPIKLGEYLLCGLPVIASKGIGDTEEILQKIPHCYLFDHENKNAVSGAANFVQSLKEIDHEAIRKSGLQYFSLSNSAESYIHVLSHLSLSESGPTPKY